MSARLLSICLAGQFFALLCAASTASEGLALRQPIGINQNLIIKADESKCWNYQVEQIAFRDCTNAHGDSIAMSGDCNPVCDNYCDTCCEPACNMCPCCYGYVEALIWQRTDWGSNQTLVLNQANNQPLLTTNDLNSDWTGGVRAVVGKRLCCGYTLEAGYFGLYDQSASAVIIGNNNLMLPGDLGLATNNFFGADRVDVLYESQLNGAEVNLGCCSCCCVCDTSCREIYTFVGFRYLNLNEQFTLTSTDLQEGTSIYDVTTNNNLFGPQIGARVRRCYGRWSWEGTGKAGIFGNASEQNQAAITDFPNVVVRPAQSATDGDVAFIGELNLTSIYQINCTWGLRAGYSLMWIEGVALAANQLDFTNTPSSGSDIDTSGGIFLHGVNLGLEARW